MDTPPTTRPPDPLTDPDDPVASPLAMQRRLNRLTLGWAAAGILVGLFVSVTGILLFGAYSRLDKRLGELASAPAPTPAPSVRPEELERYREQLDRQNRLLTELSAKLERLESRAVAVAPVPPIEKPKVPVKKVETKGESPLEVVVAKKTPEVIPAKKTEPEPLPPSVKVDTAKLSPAAKRLMDALGDPLAGVRDGAAASAAYRELVLLEAQGTAPPTEVLVPMARTALMMERFPEALAWAQKADETLPGNQTAARLAALKIAATAAYRAGRFDLAAPAAEKALAKDPAWADGRKLRVRSLMADKQLEAAERAAREGPKSPTDRTELAWVLLAKADLARAAKETDTADRLTESARAELDGASSDSTAGADWPMALGLTLLRQGKAGEAVKVLKTAVERKPFSPSAQYLTGLALAKEGAADAADAAFAKAGELAAKTPNDDTEFPIPVEVAGWSADPRRQAAQARVMRGNVALAAGKLAAAEEHFRNAYLVRGDCAPAYLGAGETLMRMGKLNEAAEMLGEALQADGNLARAHLLRAVVSVEIANRSGKPTDAEAVYESLKRALELDAALRAEALDAPALKPLLRTPRFAALLPGEG